MIAAASIAALCSTLAVQDGVKSFWCSPGLTVWAISTVDEGIDTYGFDGTPALDGIPLLIAVLEGAKGPDGPQQRSPVQQCRNEAIATCGVGQVCWVLVMAGRQDVCFFACRDGHGNCPPPPTIPAPTTPASPQRPPIGPPDDG